MLTFLSPGPARSRSAVEFLHELLGMPLVDAGSGPGAAGTRDCLDELHFGSSTSSWDSVACACPASGTVLHFLSPSADQGEATSGRPALRLMAVHGSRSASSPSEALRECRRRLAGSIRERQIVASSAAEGRLRGLLYTMGSAAGGQPKPSWILEKNPSASRHVSPFFDLTPFSSTNESVGPSERESPFKRHHNGGKLRELALPFFPGSSSLQTKLSESPSLSRPLPGLYQCSAGAEGRASATKGDPAENSGLIFRPLPAAEEDLRLSPPSLVFQCESLDEVRRSVEGRPGGGIEKIGWRGHGRPGSLVVSHPSVAGLGVRVCEGAGGMWRPEGMFAEAQESLLAGSLAELQSTRVVSEGGGDGTSPGREDPNTLKSDCWVEVRANVRHPMGFFSQKPTVTKVANIPDLPFE